MTNISDDSVFDKTMKQLWKVAQKDGIITPEEYDILEQVRIDADAYHVMLQECLEDGTISKEEAEQLHKLKDLIMERALLIATIDGTFDDDERELLKKLSEILALQYQSYESLD